MPGVKQRHLDFIREIAEDKRYTRLSIGARKKLLLQNFPNDFPNGLQDRSITVAMHHLVHSNKPTVRCHDNYDKNALRIKLMREQVIFKLIELMEQNYRIICLDEFGINMLNVHSIGHSGSWSKVGEKAVFSVKTPYKLKDISVLAAVDS